MYCFPLVAFHFIAVHCITVRCVALYFILLNITYCVVLYGIVRLGTVWYGMVFYSLLFYSIRLDSILLWPSIGLKRSSFYIPKDPLWDFVSFVSSDALGTCQEATRMDMWTSYSRQISIISFYLVSCPRLPPPFITTPFNFSFWPLLNECLTKCVWFHSPPFGWYAHSKGRVSWNEPLVTFLSQFSSISGSKS